MSSARIWLATAYDATYRNGGWAYVMAEGGARSGVAGGERNVSAERILLTGVVEALKAAGGGADIHSSDPRAIAISRRIADLETPPSEDLDLWAPIATALKAGKVRFVPAVAQAGTPLAFAMAWADLGRDKAKASGRFRSPIPKPNLAKAGV